MPHSESLKNFDGLVADLLASDKRHCLLYVFLESKIFSGGAVGVRVVATAVHQVASGLDFDLVKKQAAEDNLNWDVVAVCAANNMDGSMPSVEQCKEWLEDMEKRVLAQQTNGIAFFSKAGACLQPIGVKPKTPGNHFH